MARFYQKFGRGNRVSRQGAQHTGQARASLRKRRHQATKQAELEAEAARLGISVCRLQQRRQLEVNAIIAAQEKQRVSYRPPPKPSWQQSASSWR